MRSSPARPTPPIGAALAIAALAAILVAASTVSAAFASESASEQRGAAHTAATPTELALTGPSGTVRYGAKVILNATLESVGKPIANRTVSLVRDGAAAGSASTNTAGKARFKLKATRNGPYEARFAPASPQDAAAYQPASSTPLDLVVRPLLRLKLSSPLRAGRKVVGIPRERLRISGRLLPNDGGQVTIRVLKGRRELRRASRAIVGSSGVGKFGLSFKPRARGTYRIKVQRHSGGQLGAARAARARLLVVRPSARSGSRGAGVRALQRRLNALGYLTPVTGSFGASTSRAVLAFRKANGMSRGTAAGLAVFRRLERRGGAFKLRYPKDGRHAEFDWSRQVLVLAEGARVVRVVHASSGKSSTPTVFGNFRFYRKSPGYNAKGMYFSNYFIGGYAIHGYQSVPNFPASHGCIRIPIASAVSVYRWVRMGDRISVYR